MPAKSKSQRRFFGMVHAYQQGKLDTSSIPKDVLDQIKAAAKSMTQKASKDFAESKEKGLPQHVSESRMTFKQFLISESHYTPGKVRQLARDVLKQLEKYATELPEVYKDVNDYLADMYAALPWNPSDSIEAIKIILKDPKFSNINKLWKKNHKFDMAKELRTANKEAKEELNW